MNPTTSYIFTKFHYNLNKNVRAMARAATIQEGHDTTTIRNDKKPSTQVLQHLFKALSMLGIDLS